MAYKKHPPKSRRYKRSSSHSHQQEDKEVNIIKPAEPVQEPEAMRLADNKKTSSPFSFLSAFLGSGEKAERSGSPLFKIFDREIYLDDLLLVGLIILLLTENNNDEILLIVLVYLLVDIF